jgi:uncharacterized protein YdaU (DUF1376 family)
MKLTALWWWIDRWRKSSAYMDMTLAEQGAYRNLLDEAHLRGGPLPADERILAKACGDALEWPKVRNAVLARFERHTDGYHNRTLEEVLAQSIRRAANQANYRKRDNARGNGSDNGADNNGNNKPDSPDPSPSLLSGSGSGSVSNARKSRAPETQAYVTAPIFGRDPHLKHSYCDTTLSYCVPQAVHDKLANLVAPKYGGDRDAAKDALKAWYPTVTGKLGANFVMGDAFKFWQARFDAEFANVEPAQLASKLTTRLATAVANIKAEADAARRLR